MHSEQTQMMLPGSLLGYMAQTVQVTRYLKLVGKPPHKMMRLCRLHQATRGTLQLELGLDYCHIACAQCCSGVAATGGLS